jgi:hypothetical protein
VSATRRAIDRIASRLDNLETNIISRLDLLLDQKFKDAMANCLGYQTRTGDRLTKDAHNHCVGEILAYLQDARDPVYTDAWNASLEDPNELAKHLTDENWAAHINLFTGMANADAGFKFTGQRANPARWIVASNAFITLALENQDYFSASPSLDFDTLFDEGQSLSKEFGWEISFQEPWRLLDLYRYLVARYQTAFSHVQSAAASVRAHSLQTLGSSLTDIRPSDTITDPDFTQLASNILTRDIYPAAKTSDEWRARNKLPLIAGYSDTVMSAADSWPKILSPQKIWGSAFVDADFLNWEAWALGSLQMTYVPFWSEPKWGGGGGFDSILYAKPNIEYIVKGKDLNGNLTRLGTGIAKFDSRVTAYGLGGYGGVYAINSASIDFPNYLKQNSFPLGLPTFSTDLKEDELSKQIAAARSKVLTSVRGELVTQLRSPTSDISQALDELDGVANALRGLTTLAFPLSMTRSDALRSILFGRDDPSVSKRTVAPLLTSKNALDMVLWPELNGAGPGSNEQDPTKWPNSVFLTDLAPRTEASLGALVTQIEGIVLDPAMVRNHNLPLAISWLA